MFLKINSPQNEKIKNIAKLRESGRERKKHGLFVIEGEREINLAIAGGVEIESLFYCAGYGRQKLRLAEEKVFEVSEKVFSKISWRENPDGLLAVAEIKEQNLEDIKLGANPLLIVLEAVEKPGNLGAILRTADAAGADAVVINDPGTDLYNPNVIRASQGTAFTVQAVVSSISETIKFCQQNKIKIFTAAPAAKLEYVKADYGTPCAIVLGAEDKGLSHEWLKAADEKISIRMRGRIDSLNVSVSAAVILFEALRQREANK
ncbi:MAG: RNA methyltransferase [bacterium]|nr:RNA methyltransferase [bacterium]